MVSSEKKANELYPFLTIILILSALHANKIVAKPT
jgi:hypothetical protein